jgi:Fur family zinc uptake transcriptional regulator
LRLLCLEQKAVGAYDLAAAHERESGRRTAPYTIYRALDFLQKQGLVAHLESTHTYVACAPQQGAQTSLFFVCGKCGIVTERWDPDVERTVGSAAKAIGFSTSARTIEIEGLCKECSRARK